MDTLLIKKRRQEVEAEIERLRASIVAYEAELVDLDTAERVMSRLTGTARGAPSRPDESKPTIVPPAIPAKEPPLTEKIATVLQEAYRRGLPGMEPKAIYQAIIEKGWTADLGNVRSTTFRIWKDGRLGKIEGTSTYTVPEREKTTDLLSPAGEQSAVFDQKPAQGREAVPGGGT